jgi:protein-S-isoprenylcysteine O-methyltransferase Ste14
MISGLAFAIRGFMILGIKRSFGLNFFKDNVPIVKDSIYKFVNNPEDYGLWASLAGFALFSRSFFNLAIAIEFIILMIPHLMIENIPLKKPFFPRSKMLFLRQKMLK